MKQLRLNFILAASALLCACSCCKTVNLADYLDAREDAMPAIRRALDDCGRVHATRLILPSDTTLRVFPDFAYEEFQFVSNNDFSLKRIAFRIDSRKNFKVVGHNTRLLFSGHVSPFSITSSKNVTVEGVSIDYVRTFHSEGLIEAVGDGWVDVRFPESYDVRIVNGCLHFRNDLGEEIRVAKLLEFDSVRREPAFGGGDMFLKDGTIRAKKLEDGCVRIFRDGISVHPGNVLVMGIARRDHPGFFISESSDILLKDITIHHANSMGVIAQCSRNIALDSVRITPSEGRVESVGADATHFSSCGGYIRLSNCFFECQNDDATNVHGLYARVDRLLEDGSFILRWRHRQQKGLMPFEKGAKVEILDGETLRLIGNSRIAQLDVLNAEYMKVKLSGRLPDGFSETCVLALAQDYPEVQIKDCEFRGNRARGLLLGSSGSTLVERCRFHTAGSAIMLQGDGAYWYEQSATRNLVVRDCIFDDCDYMFPKWGKGIISVDTRIPDMTAEGVYYHKGIDISGNSFRTSHNNILRLYCVDGVSFRDNCVERTQTYPTQWSENPFLIEQNCRNLSLEL